MNVENVNDANPQFQPLFYSANISENVADGAFVQLVHMSPYFWNVNYLYSLYRSKLMMLINLLSMKSHTILSMVVTTFISTQLEQVSTLIIHSIIIMYSTII